MSGSWGRNIRLSIYGESHGAAVGIILDGVKPGIELDMDFIERQMERRAPGRDSISTSRREQDKVQILSGIKDGVTTGTPINCMIRNQDTRSADYSKQKIIFRPSHSDHTGYVKYRGFNDHRGGGHFSGRITAGLVFAGAFAMQILLQESIVIGSHILKLQKTNEKGFLDCKLTPEMLKELGSMEIPVIDKENVKKIEDEIMLAKSKEDSVGGIVETAVMGIEPGIGDPFFHSVESVLSGLLFAIPAVKAVEFGKGFQFADYEGSQINDEPYMCEDDIKYRSNNNGGVLGGITNGMPLVFKVGVKPTASIGKTQNSVDMEKREDVEFRITGRHDPCIAKRIIPVIESVTALALLDMIMEGKKWD
ncbi:chorismate synthase [Desulfitispora alkaliphila]|uniref:chorismate synthase n=1 Tax=Desulfitispora alkaliphila TaxID=622674 RepID=UPI003D22256E